MVQRLIGAYNEAITKASRSALLELALTLASYRESIVLVGGWVPYFLIEWHGRGDFTHVGSIDIDLAVEPTAIDVEAYASIVELIEGRGYKERRSRTGEPIPFSFSRTLPGADAVGPITIQIDFLTEWTASTGSHRHRRVQSDLPARIAKGCGLAFRHNAWRRIEGPLPDGGEASARLRMLDIPGCIGMKGIVLGERYKEKDAYDIYAVVGHCLDGPDSVAQVVREHKGDQELVGGLEAIRQRFRSIRAEGPAWVAVFLQPTDAAMRERMTAEAYVTVDRFLEALEVPAGT